MLTSPSQDAPARHALIEDLKDDRKGWLQHGLAALAVSLLGLGVAGSLALTSSAEHVTAVPAAQVATAPELALPAAFSRDASSTSRDTGRPAIDQAKLKSLADQRAEELSKTDGKIAQAAQTKAAAARDKSLTSTSKATQKEAAQLARSAAERRARASAPRAAAASSPASAPKQSSSRGSSGGGNGGGGGGGGKSCMPVRGGYSIAARFGQVGAWARYHTGFDFSAPVGTPLQAPAAGVVTNAGGGPASGWAGNYVAIRHADGTQSLSAHMSTVSVSVGQSVSACQVVGAIGMTGRTFGPHVHFEIYPAGVTPRDVYRAINPQGWLAAHGVRP